MISSATSLRVLSCSLRGALPSALLFSALSLAGCGGNCFSGFFNDGFQVNTGSPSCTLTKAKGSVGISIARVRSCESCTSSARVEHIYVTLGGVQLHPGTIAERNSPDWVEIAPQLVEKPRQIDLIGTPEPELLTEGSVIPAGSYRQVRLEFVADPRGDGGQSAVKNECGTRLQNCIVMGDGRVNPVLWTGDLPQIVIRSETAEGGTPAILPDTTTWLQISLEPLQFFTSSGNEPWAARVALVGHVSGVIQVVDLPRDY